MDEPLRVVIDTNVLLAAVTSAEGVSARLLTYARTGRLRLVLSPLLLDELQEVLERPKFRRYLSLDDVVVFVSSVRKLGDVVADPPPPVVPITDDPDDDFLVVFAEVERTDAIASGDPHLIELHRPGLTVLTPRSLEPG